MQRWDKDIVLQVASKSEVLAWDLTLTLSHLWLNVLHILSSHFWKVWKLLHSAKYLQENILFHKFFIHVKKGSERIILISSQMKLSSAIILLIPFHLQQLCTVIHQIGDKLINWDSAFWNITCWSKIFQIRLQPVWTETTERIDSPFDSETRDRRQTHLSEGQTTLLKTAVREPPAVMGQYCNLQFQLVNWQLVSGLRFDEKRYVNAVMFNLARMQRNSYG